MAIKIDSTAPVTLNPNTSRETEAQTRATRDSGANSPADTGTASESVHLTGNAKLVAAAAEALANASAVNEARVEELRAAIQNGEYSINAERVADKILLLEQDL